MSPLIYTVTATVPDEPSASAFTQWLTRGHVQAVIEAGALSASVTRLDDPAEPIQIVTRYRFANRSDYDRYLKVHSPSLRADGIERFGTSGIQFERTVGSELHHSGS